jgi:FtsP/CotA-like multicopper oxidase with cupredoxin domain
MSASAVVNSILALSSLVPALPQSATNGNSNLGTLQAPTLSEFVATPNLPDGFPWGAATCNNTDPYTTTPGGGQTHNYQFNIARGFIAPDGVNRSALLVNGAFPAPTIEVNWGDTISVEVCNHITGPEEGTALHWHGILQKLTPWYDGVPSVQQCPIAPGKCFTYTFLADLYGTTWYHSHYSAQYNGGLLGALIIHGPKNVPYDIDVGPVLLTDWYHEEYFSLVQQTMTKGANPVQSDNNLINGKMNFDCSLVTNGQNCVPNAGVSKFNFQSGKAHRLRLINAGSEALMRFTIDGHNMTVMANDFVPVEPYTTDVVTLGIGQRTDIIVQATGPPNSSFWMRSDIDTGCSLNGATNTPPTGNSHALAAIYYEKADTNQVPTTTATPYGVLPCANV